MAWLCPNAQCGLQHRSLLLHQRGNHVAQPMWPLPVVMKLGANELALGKHHLVGTDHAFRGRNKPGFVPWTGRAVILEKRRERRGVPDLGEGANPLGTAI